MELSFYSPASVERRQLVLLILFLMTASLPTLTVSYPGSVPFLKTLCNFRTDHGPQNATNCGDFFKLVMMNGTHEIPCYTPNQITTVHMVSTCNIRGFFLGVQKKGFRYNDKKTLENAKNVVNHVKNLCDDYVTFSHSTRLLGIKDIEFKFNFTSKERVELRSTVVFSYSDFYNDRTTYFNACSLGPTPTPSTTPSPSSTHSSSPSPSVTPTPSSCPNYTATQISNFKCPKSVEKYKLTMDHEDENGTKYECTTTGTLRHFIFQSNCIKQEVCATEDDKVCRLRTFSIRNCQMSLDQRKREFLCTLKDDPKTTITTKLRIGIEKDSLYTCDVILLDS